MCYLTKCRERKKQKASELEHTVAALTTQLEQMAGVRNENVELQDKNLALVGQLRAREEELERLLREQVTRLCGAGLVWLSEAPLRQRRGTGCLAVGFEDEGLVARCARRWGGAAELLGNVES